MARANGGFTGGLLAVAQKAFVSGCFGCLGAGAALIVIFVIVFGVFPAQFVAIVRTLPIPLLPLVTPVNPTPTGTLPTIEVFVSTDVKPTGTKVTQIRVPTQQPLSICVRNPKGVDVRFTVRITLPTGQSVPFGSDFSTDAGGEAVCLGTWSDFPNMPGVYRVDVLIGTTIVGSTVITAVT